MKRTLCQAGINVKTLTSNSTRGASTSKAAANGLTLKEINRAAGWSNVSKTFQKHYNKTVIGNKNFGEKCILDVCK